MVTFFVQKTGAVAAAQPGLMGGRQTGSLADKMLKFLRLYIGQNIGNLLAFRKVQCNYSGTSAF